MRGHGRANPAARQRGQALVFISVTTVVVLLAMLVMFSTGQLAAHRMKLQNTADAASYSAAVVQARDLNFAAYMNRAMIANQVAVAQITSMTGWARALNDTYSGDFYTIAEVLADLSSLSAMWTVPVDIYKPLASGLKSALDLGGKAMVVILDLLIDAMKFAQAGYHIGMTVTIAETVTNVLTANDPNASLSILGWAGAAVNAVQHLQFAKSFTPASNQDGDLRNANVVSASMDLFTKNRTLPAATWLPTPLLIDVTRPFTPGVGPLVMFYFHSGGTSLKTTTGNTSKNLQGYAAADATGLFVIFDITISILGIPIPIIFPLPPLPAGSGFATAANSAWNGGGAFTSVESQYVKHRNADNDGGDSAAAVEYGGAYFNPMTAITYWIGASGGDAAKNNLDSRGGLRSYYDLKDNAKAATSNQATTAATNNFQNLTAPAYFIEIERPSNTIATSSSPTFQIGGGAGGQLDLPDAAVGSRIRAMSKGQAYFSRPKELFGRGDNKTEYGSLYSPYWQAHLVPNSLLEQAASVIGDSVLPAL